MYMFRIFLSNNITNCAYSVPTKWTKNNKTDTIYSLGNQIIDISSSNCNIAFLGNHSLHSTGIPSNCEKLFKYLPEVSEKDLLLERALKDKKMICSYLSQVIIGWVISVVHLLMTKINNNTVLSTLSSSYIILVDILATFIYVDSNLFPIEFDEPLSNSMDATV